MRRDGKILSINGGTRQKRCFREMVLSGGDC
jgi:hypothetical protein